MRFNLKLIFIGGLLFYIVQFVVGMTVGMFVHESLLADVYDQTAAFWRPELNQDPPDMSSMMPRWIAVGLIGAFIYAGIYDNIRSALQGSGVVRGLKYGLLLALIHATGAAMYSGVFNLPEQIWAWWAVEGFVNFAAGGLVLGWFAGRYAAD